MRATVRYCSDAPARYDNAFWRGAPGEEGAVFGVGYVADDIVGHELTHGVVQYTAGLFTQYQSGAINESMADVFGELIDLTDGVGDDSAGGALADRRGPAAAGYLRNMSDPTVKDHPDTMTSPLYRGDDDGASTPTPASATGRPRS